MSDAAPQGILSISIDLEVDAQHCGARDQLGLDHVTSRLLELLALGDLPATWAVADPAISAATEKLLTSPQHEIAVLGDPAWVGAAAERTRFGRELERRTRHARGAGIPVTTLALRKVHLDAHLDLVVSNGITAVRGPASTAHCRNSFDSPQLLDADLWLLSPSASLPGDSRWWPGGGGYGATIRSLVAATRRGAMFHLAIDGLALASRGRAALAGLERVLRTAVRLRDAGLLEALTAAGTVARVGVLGQGRGVSQLRPAA